MICTVVGVARQMDLASQFIPTLLDTTKTDSLAHQIRISSALRPCMLSRLYSYGNRSGRQLAETLVQKVIQRKLRLFGHICRMDDSRKIKTLVFRMMDGSNKRGRPHREWSDDIEQWCGATLQELSPR